MMASNLDFFYYEPWFSSNVDIFSIHRSIFRIKASEIFLKNMYSIHGTNVQRCFVIILLHFWFLLNKRFGLMFTMSWFVKSITKNTGLHGKTKVIIGFKLFALCKKKSWHSFALSDGKSRFKLTQCLGFHLLFNISCFESINNNSHDPYLMKL